MKKKTDLFRETGERETGIKYSLLKYTDPMVNFTADEESTITNYSFLLLSEVEKQMNTLKQRLGKLQKERDIYEHNVKGYLQDNGIDILNYCTFNKGVMAFRRVELHGSEARVSNRNPIITIKGRSNYRKDSTERKLIKLHRSMSRPDIVTTENKIESIILKIRKEDIKLTTAIERVRSIYMLIKSVSPISFQVLSKNKDSIKQITIGER